MNIHSVLNFQLQWETAHNRLWTESGCSEEHYFSELRHLKSICRLLFVPIIMQSELLLCHFPL